MSDTDDSTPRRLRREPPRFRRVEVRRAEALSPRLLRVTLAGGELDGLVVEQPAASVRLLLPSAGRTDLVMPDWNGNEFLLPDGRRPLLRTFTPRHVDAAAQELDVDIVLHGSALQPGGAAEAWATGARPGDPVAVSGPGRGYELDPDTPALLLAGDETALPAIGQLLEHVPPGLPVQVHVEVAHPDARLDGLVPASRPRGPGGGGPGDDGAPVSRGLGATLARTLRSVAGRTRPGAGSDSTADAPGADANVTVAWYDLPEGAAPGTALVAAVEAAELVPGERIWAAGEAAAVQRIRRHLFGPRGIPRAHAHVRGYWKHGRAGDAAG